MVAGRRSVPHGAENRLVRGSDSPDATSTSAASCSLPPLIEGDLPG